MERLAAPHADPPTDHTEDTRGPIESRRRERWHAPDLGHQARLDHTLLVGDQHRLPLAARCLILGLAEDDEWRQATDHQGRTDDWPIRRSGHDDRLSLSVPMRLPPESPTI